MIANKIAEVSRGFTDTQD